MENTTLIILIWTHFFADFVLQSDKMAINKSTSNKWLLFHCAVYTIPFMFLNPVFAIFNGVAHFCIDYVTSRINSKLWEQEKQGLFFTCIGADQATHVTILVLSYQYLVI